MSQPPYPPPPGQYPGDPQGGGFQPAGQFPPGPGAPGPQWGQPQQGSSKKGLWIGLGIVGALLVLIGGGVGLFFLLSDDDSDDDNEARDDSSETSDPTDGESTGSTDGGIEVGAEFTHDDWTAATGWTVTSDFADDFIVENLTLTNNSSTARTPSLEFLIYNQGTVIGSVECDGDGATIEPGQTGDGGCISYDDYQSTFDQVTVQTAGPDAGDVIPPEDEVGSSGDGSTDFETDSTDGTSSDAGSPVEVGGEFTTTNWSGSSGWTLTSDFADDFIIEGLTLTNTGSSPLAADLTFTVYSGGSPIGEISCDSSGQQVDPGGNVDADCISFDDYTTSYDELTVSE